MVTLEDLVHWFRRAALLENTAGHIFPYQKGRVKFHFASFGHIDPSKVFTEEKYDYEKRLISFLCGENSAVGSASANLLILRGPAGSGKSTAIRYALNEMLRESSTREVRPSIFIDFNDWHDPISTKGKNAAIDAFWDHVKARFEECAGFFSEQDEIVFWHWLSGDPKRLMFLSKMSNFLFARKHIISEARTQIVGKLSMNADTMKILRQDRIECFSTFSAEDLAWYFILLFSWRYQGCGTNASSAPIVIIDNVDALRPAFQREIVHISLFLASRFPWKFLVCLRPLTWENNYGFKQLEVEDHLAPMLTDVLSSRLQFILDTQDISSGEKDGLRVCVDLLRSERGVFTQILNGTSGLNVRLCLANFFNLALSPLVMGKDISNGIISAFRPSELARIFFYSDEHTINKENLENIFTVDGNLRRETLLLKLRIIDFLLRVKRGRCDVREIGDFCSKFYYDEQLVIRAVNELLYHKRALIWIEDDFMVESLQSRCSVLASPLAYTYATHLFGEYFYMEVCIAKDRDDVLPVRSVLEFHYELFDQDMLEVKRVMQRGLGRAYYLSLYPDEIGCISLQLWKRFLVGLKHRDSRERESLVHFDAKKENHVRNELKDIIGSEWM